MTLHSGIDQSEFSPTDRAQDDFFRYVSGPWEDTHPIPSDRAADGSFYTLRDEAEAHTRTIIEEAPAESVIGALYASFMDVERVDSLGIAPLLPDLEPIEAATSHEELARAMGALQRSGVTGIVGYYVFADRLDPDRNVVYLSQSGLGLPDEAYYREDAHAATREKYAAHLDRMAELTGLAFDSATVMALETAVAKEHWDVVKTREAELTHNPTTLTGLAGDAPGFPWATWADAIRMPATAHDLLVAGEPTYFTAVATVWAETDLETWKAYLRWRVVNSRAAYLTQEIAKANFDFYGTVLSGATEQRERWKRGVGFVEGVAGELVGQEYVQRHFPPAYKEQMDVLVGNLIEAYRRSILELDWMTEATKEKALEKLRQFTPKIGYPDKWRDYSALEVTPDDLVGNLRAACAFEEDWEWAKIGKPVDRSEWLMTPQTVNAYYLPVANEIVFPAAILQPPFFHPEADDAVNYGGIGSVIGHEIGHGFDDQGSKYSGTGALEDWWTEADREAFMTRATMLIEQYNGYSPRQLSDEHRVNGALTVGENIGDLAGVEIALKAYEIALGHPIEEAPELDGLTALQRFFIGYALTERMKVRDEALVTRLSTDPHSPSEFRVNGIVRNLDPWYAAFEVSEGDELWLDPEARVSIW
ncbi:M13 family metallopeptidase [Demequina lignilytica]|uniref:M13-type metalloendopeptidase n=1 Tax=Demequina lignilytica TaxID=3051663 RepID=A0AB35MHA5_9MICO|nr:MULTISPECIES: M13-type metalloendopeptidase [unclassified Demequina]MDN4483112.1 M13-type metalloendopeptidase [Demequina sp. SYSU T0a273]MDN4490960.1 M13-type metalloendopeptidase [Demequina sp. SYSU T00068]